MTNLAAILHLEFSSGRKGSISRSIHPALLIWLEMCGGLFMSNDELFQRSDRGLQINCEAAETETTVDEERCSNALSALELDQLSLFFIHLY